MPDIWAIRSLKLDNKVLRMWRVESEISIFVDFLYSANKIRNLLSYDGYIKTDKDSDHAQESRL